jgi:hypothetical protein
VIGLLLAQSVILAVGAEGEPEYGARFAEWAGRWERAAEAGGAVCARVADRAGLRAALEREPKETPAELWIVLIGHGTDDGRSAKFNLRGEDVAAAELAEWLAPFRRPVAVVNAASASAPWIPALSEPGRVIVTATKSGQEQEFARLGDALSQAIGGTEADLDKDGQTSLLEALLWGEDRTARGYEEEGRLATEHPLVDDNGDKLGTRADWFRGVRVTRTIEGAASPDGRRAHQFVLVRSAAERALPADVRAERDRLELEIFALRDAAPTMGEGEYLAKLEPLLLRMARLYAQQHRP